jgi:hypothetical protein
MLDKSNQRSLSLPATKLARLDHLRSLSNLWDEALRIPGTNFRVGLESVIGLFPFGGDAIGVLLSCYILFHAIQLRLPKVILLKMTLNVIIDGVIGGVPILGDLFDSTWKANTRNVNLLEAHLRHPTSNNQGASQRFLIFLSAGLILAIVMLALVSVILIKLLVALNT